ncbi:MAG: hypothetical protein LRZ92_04255 [Methanosarcinaceae archaeon]|jgi:F0F1-type ATP synthase assembly protein I|nr:hypothetical protein [Methanosarcinaceae archaeon]NKQ38989.1 hypothetical protein [Methanosarcinales archaeon]
MNNRIISISSILLMATIGLISAASTYRPCEFMYGLDPLEIIMFTIIGIIIGFFGGMYYTKNKK